MAVQYQTEVLYRNYLKQVKNSGILDEVPEAPRTDGDGLSSVLASSRSLARREFAGVHREMVALFERTGKIEKSIKLDIEDIQQRYPEHMRAWHEVFEEFEHALGGIFDYAQRSLIGSFDEKVRRMDNFSICLFGKTKAGKSTTMEALTCGKGETIGKGRQNTTLEAQEYQWRGLTVIDTPGIDSMQQRRELETTALEYADGSDLIVFLMPHQIEEAEFVQFGRFYKQNKPMVILLNIKADTGLYGTPDFEDFLAAASSEVFDDADIAGYQDRINTFVLEHLGIPKGLVPIVPVHSLSAFMARTAAPSLPAAIRRKLYEISRFESLERHLVEEVQSYGELYRIKNPYDTLILFSRDIADHFRSFSAAMEKQKGAFEANVKRFADVAARIRRQHAQKCQVSLGRYFAAKRSAVRGVVDELFDAGKDKDKQDAILQRFMPESQVREKIDKAQAEIRSYIEKEITDFFRSFEHELKAIAVEAKKTQVGHKVGADMANVAEIGETADLLKGLGVASSVVSGVVLTIVATEFLGPVGTILWVGTANFWNPVGWALLGLGVVLGWFGWQKAKEMREKLRKAKEDAAVKLSESVDRAESDIKDGLAKWVDAVLAKIQTDHIDVMDQYARYAGKHLDEVAEVTAFLDSLNSRMQKAKFQSMMRRFLNDASPTVTDVTEAHGTVTIHVEGGDTSCHRELEKLLSRVEERTVIVRRPKCHN